MGIFQSYGGHSCGDGQALAAELKDQVLGLTKAFEQFVLHVRCDKFGDIAI